MKTDVDREEGTVESSANDKRAAAATALIDSITGSWKTQAIRVASELRIPDLLADGPKTFDTLASETESHPPSLHRLLRALVTIDICEELSDGSFALTATGSLLRSVDGSLRSWSILWGSNLWSELGRLLHCVRTGESARKAFAGSEGFEHLEEDEQLAMMFDEAVAGVTRLIADTLVQYYDFSGIEHAVEIGGGHGETVVAILKAYPDMSGTVFDREHASAGATRRFADAGVASRCDFVAGNFFESVPSGGDLYLLKSVIHDWDDQDARLVLDRCREAMRSDGRLLLIERVMPSRITATPQFRNTALSDLIMLVGQTGRERSKAEFRDLLESAGFHMTSIRFTPVGFALIEGRPF